MKKKAEKFPSPVSIKTLKKFGLKKLSVVMDGSGPECYMHLSAEFNGENISTPRFSLYPGHTCFPEDAFKAGVEQCATMISEIIARQNH